MRTVVLHTKDENDVECDKYEQTSTSGESLGEQIDRMMDTLVHEDYFVYHIDVSFG